MGVCLCVCVCAAQVRLCQPCQEEMKYAMKIYQQYLLRHSKCSIAYWKEVIYDTDMLANSNILEESILASCKSKSKATSQVGCHEMSARGKEEGELFGKAKESSFVDKCYDPSVRGINRPESNSVVDDSMGSSAGTVGAQDLEKLHSDHAAYRVEGRKRSFTLGGSHVHHRLSWQPSDQRNDSTAIPSPTHPRHSSSLAAPPGRTQSPDGLKSGAAEDHNNLNVNVCTAF